MSKEHPSSPHPAPDGAMLDVGVGDLEASAKAIPNVIARLIETETWRNSATVVMAVLLLGLGHWAYNAVGSAIADARASGLEALLETVVKGVDVWVEEYRGETLRWARDPAVVDHARALASAAALGNEPGASCSTPSAAALVRALEPALATRSVAGFMLLDRGGLVLAADAPVLCGRKIRAAPLRRRLDDALDGKAAFVPPYGDDEVPIGGAANGRRPVAWFVVPVQEGPRPAAALAFAVVADRDLANIFSAARPGNTAEVYAFSDDGLMLTESRFADELVAIGLVPENGPRTAVLQVRVRDPGGDLASGHVPKVDADARALTEPAALAVAARAKATQAERRGIVIEPYRSYRGTEAIGAWRWLASHDMGVIAEISAAEAFAPLRSLVIAFSVIGGFVVLMLAAALISSLSLSLLQRQFGRLQRLGAYTLERELDEGGMATVYLARHALLKRPTAVKVLKKHVATDEFVARFEREVQLASRLRHPNNVQIYDFGRTREGAPYYAMEYLDGITLGQLVSVAGAIPAARAIHILRQICAALREAHQLGMVHRDVKPENIMVCRRGEDDFVKLLDYGLVKNVADPATRDLTKQLRILGTPRYMAPERLVDPADVDARSDLYAVGAVGFLMLTGRHLFESDNDRDIGSQVLHAPPPRASEKAPFGVPAELDEMVFACVQKDRARRPQTAEAMMEVLSRLAGRHPWTQRDAHLWWEEYRDARAAAKPAAQPPKREAAA